MSEDPKIGQAAIVYEGDCTTLTFSWLCEGVDVFRGDDGHFTNIR